MDTNMNIIGTLELVMETLRGVEVKATENNLDRMLGSLQTLRKISDELKKYAEQEPEIQVEPVSPEELKALQEQNEPIPMQVEEIRPEVEK